MTMRKLFTIIMILMVCVAMQMIVSGVSTLIVIDYIVDIGLIGVLRHYSEELFGN